MKAALFVGVAILALAAAVLYTGGERQRPSSPAHWANACFDHCSDYAGEFALQRRRTLQGGLYGVCKCMGANGVVAESIRIIELDGTIGGATPFKRTPEVERLDQTLARKRAAESAVRNEKAVREGADLLRSLGEFKVKQELACAKMGLEYITKAKAGRRRRPETCQGAADVQGLLPKPMRTGQSRSDACTAAL